MSDDKYPERRYLPRKEDIISVEFIAILLAIVAGFLYHSVMVVLWGYLIIVSVGNMFKMFWLAWADQEITDSELISEYGSGPIVLFMMLASGSWVLMMVYGIISTNMWNSAVSIILLFVGGFIGAVVMFFGIEIISDLREKYNSSNE